jgi:hypothetical protein
MTKRRHQPDGRSTIYRGADGLWHGRVSMGLTDQGRKDRRHVSSSKTVVTREWPSGATRDDGLAQRSGELDCQAWLTWWNTSRGHL